MPLSPRNQWSACSSFCRGFHLILPDLVTGTHNNTILSTTYNEKILWRWVKNCRYGICSTKYILFCPAIIRIIMTWENKNRLYCLGVCMLVLGYHLINLHIFCIIHDFLILWCLCWLVVHILILGSLVGVFLKTQAFTISTQVTIVSFLFLHHT